MRIAYTAAALAACLISAPASAALTFTLEILGETGSQLDNPDFIIKNTSDAFATGFSFDVNSGYLVDAIGGFSRPGSPTGVGHTAPQAAFSVGSALQSEDDVSVASVLVGLSGVNPGEAIRFSTVAFDENDATPNSPNTDYRTVLAGKTFTMTFADAQGTSLGSASVVLNFTSGNLVSSTNPNYYFFNGTAQQVAAVPEPASWAMMIGGFGLVGGALRSTRRQAALASA